MSNNIKDIINAILLLKNHPNPAPERATMIGLSQYQSFVAVAEELHFGRAAEKLGVAQSAISRDVAALERQLRAELFLRTTRKVSLTEFGERFYFRISQALQQIDNATKLARLESEGLAGSLRISYMNFSLHSPMVGHICRFKQDYPDVAVELLNSHTDQIVEWLNNLRIDAGVVVGEPTSGALNHATLSAEKLAVVLPVEHPLAARAEVRFKDLANESFILGSKKNWRGFRETIDRTFVEHGVTLNVSQEVRSSDVMFGLVEVGAGVTVYPNGIKDRLAKGLVMRPLEDTAPVIKTTLAWHAGNKSGPLKRFLDIAQETFPDQS